jgi:hypothetical protein
VIAGKVTPVAHAALIRERVPDRLTFAVRPAAFDLKGGRRGAPNESWWKAHRFDLMGQTEAH